MNKVIYFILLTYLPTVLWSQNTWSGKVIDWESGNPLSGASIYIPELQRGTDTNVDGEYLLENIPSGTFQLVVSLLGYTTQSLTIKMDGSDKYQDFRMRPSIFEMEGVIVSSPFHHLQDENVMKVDQVAISDLKEEGAVTLIESLSNLPGLSNISTGIGIGKPVIRGLSSNRIVVYTQGVRLENQQYEDEHGLGLNAAGIASVEIIKGPASLLFGSDALGGVLVFNPEKYAPINTVESDASAQYFSNTQGYNINFGARSSGSRFSYLLRAAHSAHSDYETGDGDWVLNSRFKEYDLKTGLGYKGKNILSDFRYNSNSSKLGVPDKVGTQDTSKNPLEPFQQITNHVLSWKNNLFFGSSYLETDLGFIYNDRKEFPDPEEEEIEEALEGEPALHMKLKTFNYNIRYHLPETQKLETVIGVQGMFQRNSNSGFELLIPDATVLDFGAMATAHYHWKTQSVQFGLRYDYRAVDAEAIDEEEAFTPRGALDKDYNSINAALGYLISWKDRHTLRINVSSGFRAPNLSELTSNGVHEGTNRFEIGDPELKNEQNLQFDLGWDYGAEHLEIYLNGFYNLIGNYIFLEPTQQIIDGNPVFLYRQGDAFLYGGEVGIHLHPHPLDWLHFNSDFETVTGSLRSGEYLPLIPANTWVNTLRAEFEGGDTWKNHYAFLRYETVFRQSKVAVYETETPSYNLLSLGVGTSIHFKNVKLGCTLSATNLLNEPYIAHLSRLKNFGIPNQGRNIVLGLQVAL